MFCLLLYYRYLFLNISFKQYITVIINALVPCPLPLGYRPSEQNSNLPGSDRRQPPVAAGGAGSGWWENSNAAAQGYQDKHDKDGSGPYGGGDGRVKEPGYSFDSGERSTAGHGLWPGLRYGAAGFRSVLSNQQ